MFGNFVRRLRTSIAELPRFEDLEPDVKIFVLYKLSSLFAAEDRTLASVGLPDLPALSRVEIEEQLQIVLRFLMQICSFLTILLNLFTSYCDAEHTHH